MASATNKVYRLLSKTVQLEILTDTYGKVKNLVDIPVICDGLEENHTWEFKLSAAHDSWHREGICYNTYAFSLSLKPLIDFKYERGFYKVKITANINNEDVVIVDEKNDLQGPDYNLMRFDKDLPRTTSKFPNVTVEVTLQSYVMGSRFQTPFKWFLDNGSLADVVIKTKDKDFPCHKLVLASVSGYFREKFDVDLKDKRESVVDWVNVYDPHVVHDFLHYVYTGQTPANFAETSSELLDVAHACSMDGLKRLCAYQLKSVINVDNMGNILRVAVKNKSQELQEIAVNFIVENYDLNGDSPPPWESLEPEFRSQLAISMLTAMIAKKMLF